jgi:hypothetical protein
MANGHAPAVKNVESALLNIFNKEKIELSLGDILAKHLFDIFVLRDSLDNLVARQQITIRQEGQNEHLRSFYRIAQCNEVTIHERIKHENL